MLLCLLFLLLFLLLLLCGWLHACFACVVLYCASPRVAFAYLLLGVASVVDLRFLCGWGEKEGPKNQAASGWVTEVSGRPRWS